MILTPSKSWLHAFAGFGLYFGVLLILRIIPGVGGRSFAILLALSLILLVPALTLLALWAVSAFAIAKLRKRPLGQRSSTAGRMAVAGLSTFVLFITLSAALPARLPTGSYDRQFDRAIWLAPESTAYISEDVTPRQKMLADVVRRLPGKNRVELESMLGPSLETPYFHETGRDLIYVTGPERDTLFSLDSEWLLIWIDENGVYKRHAIVTD